MNVRTHLVPRTAVGQARVVTLLRGPLPQLPSDAVVVVGAGAAGLALTLRLRQHRIPVVLLEAGGPDDAGVEAPDAPALPPVSDDGVPFRLDAGRGRGLGGTAELWHGQCTRLHPEQLADRPWLGLAGWPFLPRYDQAERMLELTGRGYDGRRWAEHPDLAAPLWRPELLRHDFTEYAPKHRLGSRWREQLRADPGVHVLLGATAVEAETGGHGEVSAVRIRDGDGRPLRIPARRAVLAGGAVENARLLQLSDPAGIGIGSGRWHVGRWLQDHPVVRTAEVRPTSGELQDLYAGLRVSGRRLFPKVRLSPDQQRAQHLLDATAVFRHDVGQTPLDRLRAGRFSTADVRQVARAARRRRQGLSAGFTTEHVWLDLWLEQRPRAESRVTLGTELDRHGLPRPAVDWRVGDDERRTSRALTESVVTEVERLGLGEVEPLAAMTEDVAWDASVTDAFHPAGTTRMAVGPTDGVVDPDLQVHGVPGLSVVGSSVFPTSGYANPTLTIVALALRLGDHLATRAA